MESRKKEKLKSISKDSKAKTKKKSIRFIISKPTREGKIRKCYPPNSIIRCSLFMSSKAKKKKWSSESSTRPVITPKIKITTKKSK